MDAFNLLRCVPVLLMKNASQLRDADVCVPRSRGAAQAIGVGMDAEIWRTQRGPNAGCVFCFSATVLCREGQGSMGFIPEGFSCGGSHGFFDFGSSGAEAKRLAVRAVAKVEAFFGVTMRVH